MTWSLYRQDPALQTLYATVPMSLTLAVLLRLTISAETVAVVAGSPPIEWQGGMLFLGILIWLTFQFFIVAAGFWSRCSTVHMGLPISTRRLWTVRVMGILTATLAPLLGMIVVLGIDFPGPGLLPALIPGVPGLGFRIGSGLIFMAIAYQSLSPSLRTIPISFSYFAYIILVTTTALAYLILSPVSILSAVLPLAMALALGVRLFLALPASFTLGISRERGGDSEAGYRDGKIIGPRGTLHLAILRSFTNHRVGWFLFPVLAAESLIATVRYYEGEHYLLFAIFAAMFPWLLVGIAIQKLYAFDYLPVSRRLLHIYALMPCIVVVVLTIGITTVIAPIAGPEITQVKYRNSHLQVPPELWEMANADEVPVISSPWGETYQPEVHRLAGARSPGAYNPFDHGRDNSARFARLQTARAVEAVHGITIDATYHTPDSENADEAEAIEEGCCRVVEQSIGLTSPVRRRALAVVVSALAVACTFLFYLSVKAVRATVLRPLYIGAFPSIGILALVVILYAFLGERFGFASRDAIGTMPLILARKFSAAVPVSTTVLWAMAAVVIGAAYCLSAHAFSRAESPRKRCKNFMGEYSN